jgi:hypothetical protein
MPNPSIKRTRTLFYFRGHIDLTKGEFHGYARSTKGEPLRN